MNQPIPNTGALFKNGRKGENAKAPDYRGGGNYKGQSFEIAAWICTTRSGRKYMSLRFKPPYQPGRQQASQAPAAAPAEPVDDQTDAVPADVPF